MRFELIDAAKEDFPVTRLCQILDVSPSGYFAWRLVQPARASGRIWSSGPHLRLVGEGGDEAGEVDLGLVAGRRLEADLEGLGPIGRADDSEEALHGRVGALVSALADLAGEPDRTQVREGGDALAQIIEIRRQLAGASHPARAVGRWLEATGDVLADGLGIAAGAARNG